MLRAKRHSQQTHIDAFSNTQPKSGSMSIIVISFISEWIYMNIYYTCFQSDDKLWFKKSYLEVVVADHRLPDPQALHGSHQVLIVDKPFDGNVQLMVNGLDKNYIYNCWGGKPIHVHQSNLKKRSHLIKKSSLALVSPAVWMKARRSVAADAIRAREKSKN